MPLVTRDSSSSRFSAFIFSPQNSEDVLSAPTIGSAETLMNALQRAISSFSVKLAALDGLPVDVFGFLLVLVMVDGFTDAAVGKV
jgi:hypothetical protein